MNRSLTIFGLFFYLNHFIFAFTISENNQQLILDSGLKYNPNLKGKIDVKTASLEVGGFDTNCTSNGRTLKEGEEFRHDHIRYQCGSDQMLHPKGCFVDEKDLAPGETFNNYETNSYHECYRTDGRIGYREHFCGYLNPCHQFPESEKQKFQPKQGLPLIFVYSKVEEIPIPMDGERPSGIIP